MTVSRAASLKAARPKTTQIKATSPKAASRKPASPKTTSPKTASLKTTRPKAASPKAADAKAASAQPPPAARPSDRQQQPAHPIQTAALHSGVSPELIRAWERRYQAVAPTRAANNRRLYSDADIERLALLRAATEYGRRIGDIAGLPSAALARLAGADRAAARRRRQRRARPPTSAVMEHFDSCFDAAARLDMSGLRAALDTAAQALSDVFFMDDLLTPLIRHMRDECRRGALGGAHARLFSATIAAHLLLTAARAQSHARLVVCALDHDADLSSLRAAAAAAALGWAPVCLGNMPPVDDIIFAFRRSRARAIAVCAGEDENDVHAPNLIRRLAARIGGERLIVCLPPASDYAAVADEIKAAAASDLRDLRRALERLRALD